MRTERGAVALAVLLVLAACDAPPAERPALEVLPAAPPEAAPGAALRPLAGLELRAPDGLFGGFSGLEVSADGRRLVAISDRGLLLQAELVREGAQARLAGVSDARLTPLAGPDGARPPRVLRDAEGLAIPAPDLSGPYAVAFERLHRVARFDGPGAPETPLADLGPLISIFGGNAGAEALAALPEGDLLAILETRGPEGARRALRIAPDGRRETLSLPGGSDLSSVGADLAPDGRLLLLERRYLPGRGFAVALRRLALPPAAPAAETLAEFPPQPAGDNAEGIAAWRDADGRTRVLILTDDNLSLMQRTLLWEFALPD